MWGVEFRGWALWVEGYGLEEGVKDRRLGSGFVLSFSSSSSSSSSSSWLRVSNTRPDTGEGAHQDENDHKRVPEIIERVEERGREERQARVAVHWRNDADQTDEENREAQLLQALWCGCCCGGGEGKEVGLGREKGIGVWLVRQPPQIIDWVLCSTSWVNPRPETLNPKHWKSFSSWSTLFLCVQVCLGTGSQRQSCWLDSGRNGQEHYLFFLLPKSRIPEILPDEP